MSFGSDFESVIRDRMTPTVSDLTPIRSLVLEVLSDGGEATTDQLLERWLATVRIAPDYPTAMRVERDPAGGGFAVPSRDDPYITVWRSRAGLLQILAELIADGLITAVTDDNAASPGYFNVHVQHDGGGSGFRIPWSVPSLSLSVGSRWRLLVPQDHPREVMDAASLCEGLEGVLGVRGIRCLREAHRSYRARLWLASSTLLAATSEAAWYQLARRHAQPGTELERLANEGRATAKVIELTSALLLAEGARRDVVNEVTAMAQYFRDVRNYGLHPRDDHDEDREVPLTESGATVLVLQARRYLTKLAGLM